MPKKFYLDPGDFSCLPDAKQDELVAELIAWIRTKNHFPIYYFNEAGVKEEILKVAKKNDVKVEDGKVYVTRKNELKTSKQLHGTTNSVINNMMIGVSEGFKKELEINGVGYRFQVQGNKIVISAGYSHPVELMIPEGIKVEMPEKSTTELIVSGYDKQAVTEFAANIRKVRQPEPYKGKGIKYKDEHIRRKEGKKAA